MNITKYFISAVALLAIVSCAQEGENSTLPESGEQIFVTTSVAATRSEVRTDDNLEEFALFVNSSSADYCYDNVVMTKSNGEWIGSRIYWAGEHQTSNFAAYAPISSAISTYQEIVSTIESDLYSLISDDQSTQEQFLASDIVYAHAAVQKCSSDQTNSIYYSESTGFLHINFEHACTMLIFNLQLNSEFIGMTNPMSNVVVGQVVDGVQIATIVPYATYVPAVDEESSSSAQFMAIIAPRTTYVENYLTLSFEIAGVQYEWVSDNLYNIGHVSFEAGVRYEINDLELGDNVIIGGTISCGDWIEGAGDDLNSDFPTL